MTKLYGWEEGCPVKKKQTDTEISKNKLFER